MIIRSLQSLEDHFTKVWTSSSTVSNFATSCLKPGSKLRPRSSGSTRGAEQRFQQVRYGRHGERSDDAQVRAARLLKEKFQSGSRRFALMSSRSTGILPKARHRVYSRDEGNPKNVVMQSSLIRSGRRFFALRMDLEHPNRISKTAQGAISNTAATTTTSPAAVLARQV